MAKQTSLAAKTGEVVKAEAAGFQLPAIFQRPMSPVQSRTWAPQVVFAHPKRADEYKKIIARFGGVDEGDMYFIFGDRLEKLDIAKMSLICCQQYWCSKKEGTGDVLAVSFGEMPHPFKEHILAVVLVYLEDRIYPANIEFRTTKCPAGKELADALAAASEPSWADLSAAHKETLAVQQPFGRFYGDVKLGDSRPGKASGMPYKPLHAQIKPTSVPEWRMLDAFAKDPETNKLLELCAGRYQQKLKDLEPKMIAQPTA